ncbi:hypothetical protein [Mycolicibacterium houstonense]|uniref:hypothetical protein n=1 Tax=Mycolicibacterium houstonense TaxID=146021 RepID=UPI00082CF847|nr:hypothetical protein [Mycolicibacterium houstonense]
MVIDIGEPVAVVDEAAAILEAEWLRLVRDGGWHQSVESVYAGWPAACPVSPRVRVLTCARHGPRLGHPLESQRCAPPRRRATRVWATQRAPPAAVEDLCTERNVFRYGEVMRRPVIDKVARRVSPAIEPIRT